MIIFTLHREPSLRNAGRRGAFSVMAGIFMLLLFQGVAGADETALGSGTSDVVVLVRGADRLTLFSAHPESKSLYYQDVDPNGAARFWDRSGFQKLVVEGTPPVNPYALAAGGSYLYVVDRANEAIYAIDLESRVSRILLARPEVSKPSSIAVSAEGLLAIGQDNNSVLLFDPRDPAAKPQPLKGSVATPTRLIFEPVKPNGSDLLVLDSGGDGSLVFYQSLADKPGEYSSSTIPFGKDLRVRLSWLTKAGIDLAYTGKTLYLTNARQWVAFSHSGSLRQLVTSFKSTKGFGDATISGGTQLRIFTGILSLLSGSVQGEDRWIALPEANDWSTSRLVGVDGDLFVLDTAKEKIMRLPLRRMTIRLEVKASEANVLLTDLYGALASAALLPSRQTTVNAASDFLQVLRKERVLTPGDFRRMAPSSPVDSQVTPSVTERLEQILCSLNSTVNGWQCPPSEQAGRVGLLQRKFGQGQILVLPGFGVESTRFTGPYRLQPGETIEEALKERMLTKTPRSTFTTEYLMRLNRVFYRTLEYEMTRRGYVLTNPSPSMAPPASGTLVKFIANRETPISVAPCVATWEGVEKTQSRSIPALSQTLRLHAPSLEYLPRTTTRATDQSIMSEWLKRGFANIEITFTDAVEEIAPRELLKHTPPTCWTELQGKESFLLWDLIRVGGVKYRLLNADGKPETPSAEDLMRWGLAGVPDARGGWSVRVDSPYVLGYRVLPWDGKPFTDKSPSSQIAELPESGLRVVSDPGALKPGSGQDIWSKRNGEFTLPGYRWQLNLLIDPANTNLSQTIKQWASKYPGKIFVWNGTDTAPPASSPATIVSKVDPATAPEDFTAVIENRKQLHKAISFPEGERSADIVIGLLEDDVSIELLHPDFAWRNVEDETCGPSNCFEYVWLVPAQNELNPVMRLRNVCDRDAARLVHQNHEIDWIKSHGTHVAGLLVSNHGDVKGIVPDATLFWIRLGNAEISLPDQITEAVSSSVEVFNVSQEFSGTSFDWLQNRMPLDLKDRLFVVAAGNSGIDVNSSPLVPRPLSWVLRSPNMVGVSAVDFESRLLGSDGSYRVNYGMKYVEIVAPGENVYSSTTGGSYAPASGSSQAVPLVAGTAALLYRKLFVPDPSVVKGRLLYTTDWSDSYLGKVWAGSLNADRALWGLERDLFEFEFGDGTQLRHRAMTDESNAKLTIVNWNNGAYKLDPGSGESGFREPLGETEKRMFFKQVLRLTRLTNGLYRIIYLEKPSNRLRIIMDASIEGTIKYRDFEEIADKTPTPHTSTSLTSLSLNKVTDFVGKARRLGAKVTF